MKQDESDYAANEQAEQLAQQKREEEARAQGFTSAEQVAAQPVYNYKNPSVDQAEMYAGVSLLQLGDHAEDYDDIVPEFNDAPVLAKKAEKKEEKKTDFAGQTYTEVYE